MPSPRPLGEHRHRPIYRLISGRPARSLYRRPGAAGAHPQAAPNPGGAECLGRYAPAVADRKTVSHARHWRHHRSRLTASKGSAGARPSHTIKKGMNILDRIQVSHVAQMQNMFDFPPAPELGRNGIRRPEADQVTLSPLHRGLRQSIRGRLALPDLPTELETSFAALSTLSQRDGPKRGIVTACTGNSG
jgi:hypothetical protein